MVVDAGDVDMVDLDQQARRRRQPNPLELLGEEDGGGLFPFQLMSVQP